jgi:hypothetical protein
VRLIARNGHDWTERYPVVVNAVHLLVGPAQSTVRSQSSTRNAWQSSIAYNVALGSSRGILFAFD